MSPEGRAARGERVTHSRLSRDGERKGCTQAKVTPLTPSTGLVRLMIQFS